MYNFYSDSHTHTRKHSLAYCRSELMIFGLLSDSDRILSLIGQDLGSFIASLNPSNLLEQCTIHSSLLGVHQSAKFVPVPVLEFKRRTLHHLHGWTLVVLLHLFPQVLLVSE